jgi:2-polyprenyl-6-hydroxyphenyl methylase/3-demethylubiquinone-9 3-methyltransferase
MRNDLTIYDQISDQWWSDDVRWVRILKNLTTGRLSWFDRRIDWKGRDVLDLGCAGGFMAEALASRGANVTGIDPAQQAIEEARRHAKINNLTIEYNVGAGENLPYPDRSFDIVVCVDVLEHVADLQKVINEIARVLRPGGCFVFDIINRTRIARLATITVAEEILRILPRGVHDPDLFIKPEELRTIMGKAGLQPGDITGLGPTGIDRRFDPVFGRIPFTGIIYMGLAYRYGEN